MSGTIRQRAYRWSTKDGVEDDAEEIFEWFNVLHDLAVHDRALESVEEEGAEALHVGTGVDLTQLWMIATIHAPGDDHG